MGPEASLDPPGFNTVASEREIERLREQRYRRENALNLAVRWAESTPDDSLTTPHEVLAAARDFEDYLNGDTPNAD